VKFKRRYITELTWLTHLAAIGKQRAFSLDI